MRSFHTSFWTINKLCELTTRELGLNVSIKDLWCTQKNQSQKYLSYSRLLYIMSLLYAIVFKFTFKNTSYC